MRYSYLLTMRGRPHPMSQMIPMLNADVQPGGRTLTELPSYMALSLKVRSPFVPRRVYHDQK